MNGRYEHVLSFALTHPWAVTPDMLSVIASILARRIAGVETERAEIEAALVNRKNLPQPRAGSVAVIPIYGVIGPRINMLSEMSGGTTFEKLTAQLRGAMADKTVKTIVFDIDSPGGSVAGGTEFATEVMRSRTKKPIISQGQYMIGSAAYHVAAASTEIIAAPSARVGSVGVFTIHNDLSKALEELGIKRTYISAGEGKVDGNETGPMSDEYHARTKAAINEAYGQFVGNVVKGRGAGMNADRVRNDWKAHVYGAAEALSIGMIDGVATLDETLQRVLNAGDGADQRAASALASHDDTAQEPLEVTAQDRRADALWQNALLGELLSLEIDA